MKIHAVAEGFEVRIHLGTHLDLEGDLTIPSDPSGLVLFAHGSGSSRQSSRNRFVAHELNQAGLATLLFDLLTRDEEEVDLVTGTLRFDIPLLAERLIAAMDWAHEQPALNMLPIGLFGASTGGAAALIVAALRPNRVSAVVSRGGRPDLAESYLSLVQAPTLLIVGGDDDVVIDLNREAQRKMQGVCKMQIIPGATHLFEEPGKLEQVAELAKNWFHRHLTTES